MEDKLKQWTAEEGVSYEFLTKLETYNQITSMDPKQNPVIIKLKANTTTLRGL